MSIKITRENRVICIQEKDDKNKDTDNGIHFVLSDKIDDRLCKENIKLYRVKYVYGGKESFDYPKIQLKVGDLVITEAVGIDIEYQGEKYKIFDTDHIVAKISEENQK